MGLVRFYGISTLVCYLMPKLVYTYIKSKVGDRSRGWPEGSLFNSYYTEMSGRTLLLSLDFSTLPLIGNLYCWVLSKGVSSTIFKVFGTTRPGIESKSPGALASTLIYIYIGFGLVLWHINPCMLFKAKACLYIYIKYICMGFRLVLSYINPWMLFNAKSCLYIYIRYIAFINTFCT